MKAIILGFYDYIKDILHDFFNKKDYSWKEGDLKHYIYNRKLSINKLSLSELKDKRDQYLDCAWYSIISSFIFFTILSLPYKVCKIIGWSGYSLCMLSSIITIIISRIYAYKLEKWRK